MPFTFSHPAIVLPLTFLPRQWFSLTGLVIGSLTPDFEYFLRMKVRSDYSHTIGGIFWFNLPLGILLCFLFHNIVRNSLFDNLPFILKSRLSTFKGFDWNNHFKAHWFVVVISIFLGSASHFLWDSFTHEQGNFVKVLSTLTETVEIYNKKIPVFKILQHASTLIGAVIIAMALYNLPVDKEINRKFSLIYWIILAVTTLAVIAFRFIGGLEYNIYGHLIATIIAAILISLTLTPLLIHQKIPGGNKT